MAIVNSLNGMRIGDKIPCRYVVSGTSNVVGVFGELGTCIANEIPIAGTSIPNGLFYFIKVDKGLLIADRCVQVVISWDTLNTGGYIEGKLVTLDSKDTLIRSLSGGCAYADANGNYSATDQSKGGFPVNNEWDTYIVNSDLDGNIVKGDNNVWHWSGSNTWVRNTPISSIDVSTKRVLRGNSKPYAFICLASTGTQGFRPVLEYLEADAKATTLFY